MSDINFKDQILKDIRQFEENITKTIDSKIKDLNLNFKRSQEQLNNLTEKNGKILNSIINTNMQIDKISMLEQFKNKVDSILITHEIRINNSLNDITALRTKYDKALLDNLLVPGFIGPACQFKNLGEYINYNISEVSKVKSEKEMIKSSFKDLRIKTDSSIKTILNLNEAVCRRCNDYTDNRISDFKELINEKLNKVNEKEQNIIELMNNFEKEQEDKNKKRDISENAFKEEIISVINNKVNELKKSQEETIYKAMNQNNDFLENYINEIFQNKEKKMKSEILELKIKVNNIKIQNDNLIKKLKEKKNNSKLPLLSSLSQEYIDVNSKNIIEEQIKKSNEENKQNQTVASNDARHHISQPKIIPYKIYQKSLLRNNDIVEQNSSVPDLKKNIYKENTNLSEKILIDDNSTKALIFDYDQKNYTSPKPKIGSPNNDSHKSILNIKTFKIAKSNYNKEIDEMFGFGEERTYRNILEGLKTPDILDKKILSNEEIKLSQDKALNKKTNLKDINKSGTDIDLMAKYKNYSQNQKINVLDSWKKNSKNWKSERHININSRVGCNFVNLELNPENNFINGANIIANRKIMNRHITKMDIPSFEKLYNVQINDKNQII